MELVLLIGLFAAGWISARFERWSDESIGIVITALIVSAIAITRGSYWQIFEPADSYSEIDNLFFGLTPNQLAATGLDFAAFLSGSILRRRNLSKEASDFGISAKAKLFRKSRFFDLEIENGSDRTIHVIRLAFGASNQVDLLEVSSTSDGQIAGNLVLINQTLKPSQRMTVEVELDVAALGEAWVHGMDAGSWVDWNVKVKIQEGG